MEGIELVITKAEIEETLERIDNSLNRRFEKDASLFISNQKRKEIKELIRNNTWQGIFGMFQTNNISSEILTIEIINNCWLIDEKLTLYDVHNYIKPVFESCNKDIFLKIAKRVMENKVWINDKVRKVIDRIYYKYIDISICRKILDSKDNRTYNKNIFNICLERVLEICDTPMNLYFTIEGYLRQYETLLHESIVFNYSKILIDLKERSWNEEFAKYIFEKKINLDSASKIEDVWLSLFKNFGEIAVYICYEYIKTVDTEEIEPKVLRRIIRECIIFNINIKDDNYQKYCEKWIINFKMAPYPIKKEFVYAVNKLNEQEVIINKMLECHMQEHLKESLINDINGKKQESNIDNIDKLKESLIENPNNNNKKAYFRYLYKAMDNNLKMSLLWGVKPFMNHEIVVDFLIQLIEDERDESEEICNIIISCIKESNSTNFIYNKFVNLMKIKKFRYNNVINFMQEADFDLYKKLYTKIV